MIVMHPTEIQIQDYALGNKSKAETIDHLQHCKECAAKANNYKTLFAEVKLQEPPVFEFNVNKLVMSQLPNPKTKYSFNKYFTLAVTGAIVLVLMGLIYILKDNFSSLVSNVAPILLYLITTVAIFVTAFLCLDLYKQYLKKINAINFSNQQQH